MKRKLSFAYDKIVENRDFLVNKLLKLLDGFASVDHKNGPGIAWGGALMELAVFFAKCSKLSLRFKRIYAQGQNHGGQAAGSKFNTRIAYTVLHNDKGDDPISDDQLWEHFDEKLFHYMNDRINNGHAVTTTKMACDYFLSFEDIIMLVGEAQSGSFYVEVFRVLVVIVRLLVILDMGWGIISNSTHVYIVFARWQADGNIEYDCLPYLLTNKPNNKAKPDREGYSRRLMRVLDVIVRIILWYQQKMPDLLTQRKEWALRQYHPNKGKKFWSEKTVGKECVLYQKTTNYYMSKMGPEIRDKVYSAARQDIDLQSGRSASCMTSSPNLDPFLECIMATVTDDSIQLFEDATARDDTDTEDPRYRLFYDPSASDNI